MPDQPHPHLRAVADDGAATGRRRRPGPAVLLVLVYAGLFGAGLLWFRSRSPLFQRARSAKAPAPAAASAENPATGSADRRRDLGSGLGLIGAAREEYLRRIATDCCSCGCDLTLERCLATEKTCPESPSRAAAILESLR